MSEPWKKAQDRVKLILANYCNTRKTAVAKAFTDTYAAGGRVVQDQPSDFWLLDNGTFYVIEVKSCHQDRFPFKDVRPSQWSSAVRIPAAGGISVFLIVKLPEWQWHRIGGPELDALRRDGHKSIGWDELEKINLKMEDIV